ncbi:hypothetical protein KQI52_16560 [bacterium]|nr:hypothetical protein [bacterium]
MIKLPRFDVLIFVALLLFIFVSGCAEHTPEEQIQLALEEYRSMVMELSDTMSQLRDNEISAEDAQSKLGADYVQRLTEQETKVRTMVEEMRRSIGNDTADAFLFKLEEYRKLGRPTVKDSTRERDAPREIAE